MENLEPEWTSGRRWLVDPEPILDIGSSLQDPEQQLYLVGDVVGSGDDLLIVNGGTSQILRYDLAGNLKLRIGRRGSGPGEFSRLSGLYRCGGDTLVANDFSRMVTLSPAGGFLRTEPVRRAPGEGSIRVRGATADCSTFVLSPGVDVSPELGQVGRRSTRFTWGSLDGTERKDIGAFPTREVVTRIVEEMAQPVPLPWGADGAWAIGQGQFHIGSTDRAEIRVFAPSEGLVAIVRWAAKAQPITEQDRQLYQARREWLLEAFPPAAPVAAPLDEYPKIPDKMPLFRSLLLDDAKNLWIRQYPRFVAGRPDLFDRDVPMRYTPPSGLEAERWTVLDSGGRWLGEVETPLDLVVRSVYRNMVIGVWKDSLDVEHVRAYRLRKDS